MKYPLLAKLPRDRFPIYAALFLPPSRHTAGEGFPIPPAPAMGGEDIRLAKGCSPPPLLLHICHQSKNILRIRAHLYIEPAAITGRNTSSTTATGVVGIIKQVWYVAVDVIASDSSLRSFGGTFSKSDQKCHQY